MSSHKRVKAVSYDDGDDDGEHEDNEYNEEGNVRCLQHEPI